MLMINLDEAIERLTAYLDQMDRVDAGPAGPQYPDDVHRINEFELRRSDVRTVLAALKNEQTAWANHVCYREADY